MTKKTFQDLGVAQPLLAALEEQAITDPFPIQELTIPLALAGSDVIGQARTGTGKTLAFGIPLLQQIDVESEGVQALVITPTRELCLQVTSDLTQAGSKTGTRVEAVYGGVPLDPQLQALRKGAVDVVVGTPGRLLDHVRRGSLSLSDVKILVLDEADEMLDMGFLPDVEQLIRHCSARRQTLLFSATMATEVVTLARRYLRHPTFIRADADEQQVAPATEQHFFLVHRLDKPRVLARVLQSPHVDLAAVFVRTKRMADRLVEELRELGVNASAIHGDLRQSRRERNLDRFRAGRTEVLVATEVAARGLDIEGITHVFNYDCPDDERMYLHRIGRTGRAGAAGVAVTFAAFNEVDRLNAIRKALGAAEGPLEEVFSTSNLLTERFDLPPETPWGRFAHDREDEPSTGRAPALTTPSDNATESDATTAPSEAPTRARTRVRGRAAATGSPGRGEGDAPPGPGDRRSAGGTGHVRPADRRPAGRTGDTGAADRRSAGRTGGTGAADRRSAGRTADTGAADGRPTSRARERRQAGPKPATGTGGLRKGHRGVLSQQQEDDGGDKGREDLATLDAGDSKKTARSRTTHEVRTGRADGRPRRDRDGEERSSRVGVETSAAGRSPRGSGHPTLVRRVRVEHLP